MNPGRKSIFLLIVATLMVFSLTLWSTDKKFRIEVFGGYSTLNPADLNMVPEFLSDYYSFYYDEYFKHNEAKGNILSWNKQFNGGFKTIDYGIPLGVRFKIRLSRGLALSIGASSVYRTLDSTVDIHYTAEGKKLNHQYDIQYSPSRLSLLGITPQAGIHVNTKLAKPINVEGFVTLGAIFARCTFSREYQHQRALNHPTENLKYHLEAEGTGIGFAAEAGTQIRFDLSDGIGFFIEGTYSFQRIYSLSGPGSITYKSPGSSKESWDGDWGIREYSYALDWGDKTVYVPSNDWDSGEGGRWDRYFELDLSGFQIRVGISIGLKSVN